MATTRMRNRYWLAGLEALGIMRKPGFATVQIIGEQWRDDEYCPYTLDGTHYSDRLKAIMLQPSLSSMMVDMDPALFDKGGDWMQTGRIGGIGGKHLEFVNTASGAAGSATSKYVLPEYPAFTYSWVRTETPPDADSFLDQEYSLSWGAGCILSWGGKATVDLQYLDNTGRPRFASRRIKEGERQAFYVGNELLWEVYCFGTEIYVYCSAWGQEPWIVRGTGHIPASTFTAYGRGGFFFNLAPFKFATTGTLSFSVDQEDVYPITDANSFVLGPGIISPAFTTAYWPGNSTFTISASDSGTVRTYTLYFHGDGDHTPIVQLFQTIYVADLYTPDDPEAVEITDFVLQQECSDECTNDNSPNSAQITIDNTDQCFITYLRDTMNRPDLTMGECVCIIELAEETTDGSNVTLNRNPVMFGILKGRTDRNPVATPQKLVYPVYDPTCVFAEQQVMNAPCMLGFHRANALRQWLMLAGIPYDRIHIDSAVDLTLQLDAPQTDFTNPPWYPAVGSSVADFIKKVCEYGYYLDAHAEVGDGEIPILRVDIKNSTPSEEIAAEFTTEAGHEDSIEIVDNDAGIDYAGTPTELRVIGKAEDGRQIVKIRKFNDAAGWQLIGGRRVKIINSPDVMTDENAEKVLDEQVKLIKRPRMTVTATTHDFRATKLRTNDQILIHSGGSQAGGYTGDAKPYRVMRRSNPHDFVTLLVTLTLEALW